MCTPVGHTLMAGTLLVSIYPREIIKSWRQWIWLAVFANLPDIDFLWGYLGGDPNRYHHQFTHSILFALLVGFFIYLINRKMKRKRSIRIALIVFILIVSHLVLDYFTEDLKAPFGIQFFWPFSKMYYISPQRIFSSVNKSSESLLFFRSLISMHNLQTILREIVLIGPFLLFFLWKQRQRG